MSITLKTNQRTKPGCGKTPYGLTPQKLAELSVLAQNEDVKRFGTEAAFFKFTSVFVAHARDLARSGQKDAARNWHRYFENAQVFEIVSSHSAVEDSSLENLKEQLSLLGTECHPLDVPDWSTDIQAIRASLQILVENLPRRKSAKVARRSGSRLSYEALTLQRDRAMRRRKL